MEYMREERKAQHRCGHYCVVECHDGHCVRTSCFKSYTYHNNIKPSRPLRKREERLKGSHSEQHYRELGKLVYDSHTTTKYEVGSWVVEKIYIGSSLKTVTLPYERKM